MQSFIVLKIGGSLLTLPDLAERLRSVWNRWPEHAILIVVGGGAAADVVRDWDQTFQLGQDASHWLAIESLDLSASLIQLLLPELRLVRSLSQMQAAHASGHKALLCVKCFMKWLETQPDPLPHHWHVTSDSIAAAVSAHWHATDLILLKSRDLPPGRPDKFEAALTAEEAVDGYFWRAADGLKQMGWINLRAETSDAMQRQVLRDTSVNSIPEQR